MTHSQLPSAINRQRLLRRISRRARRDHNTPPGTLRLHGHPGQLDGVHDGAHIDVQHGVIGLLEEPRVEGVGEKAFLLRDAGVCEDHVYVADVVEEGAEGGP